jgi:hypothetical protein
MFAVDGAEIVNIAELIAFCLAPAVTLWVLLHLDRIGPFVLRGWRRIRPVKEIASGPPLERIAADIRRIGANVEALPPRAPFVKRKGVILAYDDALGAACRALGIEDELAGLPFGPARDAVRLRVEAELVCAGLVIESSQAA